MLIKYIQTTAFLLCLLSVQSSYAAMGGGGGGSAVGPNATGGNPGLSPAELAVKNYNTGLKNRDKAIALQERAKSASTEEKRAKLLKKADKKFRSSIKYFNKSLENVKGFYQAYSSLGFAYRKTGDLQASLEAYNKSLAIKPDYPQAIEYLAETHLALGELEKVKAAYTTLEEKHPPEFAALLLTAIEFWLVKPNELNIPDAQMDSFREWAKGRKLKQQRTHAN